MHRSRIVVPLNARTKRAERVLLKRTVIGDRRFSVYRRRRLVMTCNDTEFLLLPNRNIINEAIEKFGHIKIPMGIIREALDRSNHEATT